MILIPFGDILFVSVVKSEIHSTID